MWKKRIIAAVAAAALVLPVMSGCGKKDITEEGKTVITVGYWPTKDDATYNSQEKIRKDFTEKYPDIVVKTDTYGYSVDSFPAKAAAGQLPTVFKTWLHGLRKLTRL